jgi:hypothetical protein
MSYDVNNGTTWGQEYLGLPRQTQLIKRVAKTGPEEGKKKLKKSLDVPKRIDKTEP